MAHYWKISDRDLQLKDQWFTGKEWADGTAERELVLQFFRAIERVDPRGREPKRQINKPIFQLAKEWKDATN